MKFDWPRFVREHLDTTLKLCQINFAGESEGFGPRVSPRRALPMWSRLAELFYFYFTLKLVLIQTLHHQYGCLRYEYQQQQQQQQQALDELETTNGSSSSGVSGNKWALEERERAIEGARERLRWLGDAFYELEFAIEPEFLLVLISLYMGYCQSRLYVALRGRPMKLDVLAMLLDPEGERLRVTEHQIARQVDTFLASRRNFFAAGAGPMVRARDRALRSGALTAKRATECNLALGRLERARGQAEWLVGELRLAGALVPLNRSAEWQAHMAHVYGKFVLLFQSSACLMIFAVMFSLPLMALGSGVSLHTDRPSCLVFLVELVAYNVLGLQCFCLYIASSALCAYDLNYFARELQQLVEVIVEEIWQYRTDQLATINAPDNSQRHHLNGRLMRALILYKQFIGQLNASQNFIGFVGSQAAVIMLSAPLVDRLYVAHLTHEARLLSLARDLFIVLACDVLILPNCWLHARCLGLFKSMSRLLAHVDAHQAREDRSRLVYDEHTVWLLRREQNAPEATLRRLTTRAFFLRLTYTSFIGMHFWCGLLLAPMVLKDTSHLGASSGDIGGAGGGTNLLTSPMNFF